MSKSCEVDMTEKVKIILLVVYCLLLSVCMHYIYTHCKHSNIKL